MSYFLINECLQWAAILLGGLVLWRVNVHRNADRHGDEAIFAMLERIAPDIYNEEIDKMSPELFKYAHKHCL